MKHFTVKDLIKYNSPCKSCGRKTEFYFSSIPIEDIPNSNGSVIRPEVDSGLLCITLCSTYKARLVMRINPVSNQFSLESNTKNALKLFDQYLNTHYLLAESNCKNCGTVITSDFFEYKGDLIRPIKLFTETVHVMGPTHKFTLSTSYHNNKTFVVADIVSKPTPTTPYSAEVAAMPLFKFKDREALLKRLKMIVTFS